MKLNWLKKIAARLMEIVVAILLVLLFFMILLELMNIFFPIGTSLQMLSSGGGAAVDGRGGVYDRRLKMSRGRFAYDLAESGEWAAVLEKIERNVKSKRADGIAWHKAETGMPLYDHDAVQTLKKSSATIRFDNENYIKMADNSLIIIKRYEEDLLFREKRTFMIVVDGALEGSISSEGDKSVYLEVTTPAAVTRIRAKKADSGEAKFKITVGKDKSSVVTVYSGLAEVESMGEKVVVEANHSSQVKLDVAPTKPILLPEPVILTSPAAAKTYYYRSLPPKIWFSWQDQGLADAFHLQIAHDPGFTDLLLDEVLIASSFVHGNLKHGEYYWRVSGLAAGGEGYFSKAQKITLVQDLTPPALTITMPPEVTSKSNFALTGKTEPGAEVFIGDDKIKLSATGEFKYKLKLQGGINVVVIEAIDAAGNVTYKSKLVNLKN